MTTGLVGRRAGRRILPLDAIEPTDVALVGRKATTLAALRREGFAVPDGFVIPPPGPDDPEPVPAGELAAEIVAAATALGDRPLAVRSSALAEDRPDASFAGLYETVLDVRGSEALLAAIGSVRASARAERVQNYDPSARADASAIAVLVQPMVPAAAAGVAFTADPVTGDRATTVVSAVAGVGERLVSGEATPDEWAVRDGHATARGGDGARDGGAIDAGLASAVADVARRLEAWAGTPQDVEWAAVGREVIVLQARPMTALPAPVSWDPGHPGAWFRNFRLGEWLGEPVSPLFESWAIDGIERRVDDIYASWIGVRQPTPRHVIVNGWYFYRFDPLPAGRRALLGALVGHVLPSFVRRPRRAVMMFPPLARLGIGLAHREFRERIQPAYRAAARTAEAEIPAADPHRLVELIDGLVEAAGTYFASLTTVAGYAAKAELPLAAFYRRALTPRIGGSYLDLLAGLGEGSSARMTHAVFSLDWITPPVAVPVGGGAGSSTDRPVAADGATDAARGEGGGARERAADQRRWAEARSRAALAGLPKERRRFERLLTDAQRYGVIREEQARELTLPWPALRDAILRIGTVLVGRGVIGEREEVFELTRSEVIDALAGATATLDEAARERRAARDAQRRLSPPLMLGRPSPMVARMLDQVTASLRGPVDDPDALVGIPASAGRAVGPVRVVRSPEAFGDVGSGDILVAPMTTPAWTSLFGRIAGVVTDNGGIGAHASIIAREFGIPAVMGVGDATSRLRDGELVEVDGYAGTVRRR